MTNLCRGLTGRFLLAALATFLGASLARAGITQTIPLKTGYNYVACEIDGTGASAGNDISNPNFLQMDDSLSGVAVITFWNCASQSFTTDGYTYLSDLDAGGTGLGGWYDNTFTIRESVPWTRGMGVVIYNPGPETPVFLHGNGGLTPVYPAPSSCGCGKYSFLGAQNTNYAASYFDVIGAQPIEGSSVTRYSTNNTQYQVSETDTYTSGAWTPNTPFLSLNQAGLYFVPCVTNCITLTVPTNILLSVCTNAHVAFSVTATDACCTNATVTSTPPSGSLFFMGNNTVSCVATDVCGNIVSNSFTITLVQRTFSVTCPTNKTVTNGITWQFNTPIVTNCCTNLSIQGQTPTTNGSCPQIITKTWIITNSCGDFYTCTQVVTNVCSTNTCTIIFPPDQTNACSSNILFGVPQIYSPCCFSGTNIPSMSIMHGFAIGALATDGAFSHGGVIEGSDGELYGMDTYGGSTYQSGSGFNEGYAGGGSGVFYRIDKGGANFTVLKNFDMSDPTIGGHPYANLLEASDHRLYGTLKYGGTNNGGVVFGMDKDGNNYQVLHRFDIQLSDGINPDSTLVEGTNGYLYGTAQGGIIGNTSGLGIVFTVDKSGNNYGILHTFEGFGSEGNKPVDGLAIGPDKMLYGLTYEGGSHNNGTVYKINQNGNGFQVIHHFDNSLDEGQNPQSLPFLDADGTIYGTTSAGGVYGGGTFFKIPPAQSYQLLYSFGGVSGDGNSPSGRLTQLCDGTISGTTQTGGNSGGAGTVYKIAKDGSGYLQMFGSLSGYGAGGGPLDGVLFASDGTLYLTTSYDYGVDGYGALLQLGCAGITNGVNPCCTNAIITTNSTVTNSGCSFSVTRSWSVTTSCGFTTNGSQTITLTNSVSFISTPGGTNYGCSTNNLPTDASIKSLVIVSSGCSSNTTSVSHSDTVTGCTTTRNFTILVTNACGVLASTNVQYSWSTAAGAPSLSSGYVANKYVGCGSAIIFDTPTATNPCTGLLVNGVPYSTIQSNNCPQSSSIRTWYFTNSCGTATNFVSQTVTITNATGAYTSLPLGSYLGCSPTNLPTVTSVKAQITSTGCVTGTNVTVATDTVTNCLHYRTFTALLTNSCGSVISTNIQYSWTISAIAPVIVTSFTNLTTNILCNSNALITVNASATSACCTNVDLLAIFNVDGLVAAEGTGPESSTLHYPLGTTIVTFVATDCCGNNSTSYVTITVTNTPAPTIALATNVFKVCMDSNGCGVLGDYRTWATASYPVSQTPTSGTHICSNTTVTFSATNSCGAVFTTNATAFLGTCCDAPPLKMVLWLTFDETTGATCFNSANQGNPGTRYSFGKVFTTLIKTPQKLPGAAPSRNSGEKVGNSICFNGSSAVIVPKYTGIDFAVNSFSVDAWVKWSGTGQTHQTILAKETAAGPNTYGYELYLNSGVVYFEMYSGTSSATIIMGGGALPANVWKHVAVTVDRSASANSGFNVFLDGQNRGYEYIGNFTGNIHNTGDLYVGAWPLATTPTQNAYTGCLDEIEVFNRALSITEIQGIYNAGNFGKCRPSVSVPNPVKVCSGSNTVVIYYQVCNNGADTRSYSISFMQLSSADAATDGIANAITWNNSGNIFSPAISSFTLGPGTCTVLSSVLVKVPSNLGIGVAAYQVTVKDLTSLDTTTALGTIVRDISCAGPAPGRHGDPYVIKGTTLTNVPFSASNPNAFPVTYNGQLVVIDNNQQLDTNFVSLNNQAPGTPVNLTFNIPANGTTNFDVTVGYAEPTLLQPLYLEMLLDDGAGGPLAPYDSATLMNVNSPTVGPALFLDYPNGLPAVNWDAINNGWSLDSNTNLSGSNWSPVLLPVLPLPDGSQGVTIQPTNRAQFFRLRH